MDRQAPLISGNLKRRPGRPSGKGWDAHNAGLAPPAWAAEHGLEVPVPAGDLIRQYPPLAEYLLRDEGRLMADGVLPRAWTKPRRSPDGPTKGGNYLVTGIVLEVVAGLLSFTGSRVLLTIAVVLGAIGGLALLIGCIAIGVRIGIIDAHESPGGDGPAPPSD